MATSAGSAIIQKVVEKTRALSGSQMTQSQMTASHISRDSGMTSSQLSSITLRDSGQGVSKHSNDSQMMTSDDHITIGRAMLSEQPSLASGDMSQVSAVTRLLYYFCSDSLGFEWIRVKLKKLKQRIFMLSIYLRLQSQTCRMGPMMLDCTPYPCQSLEDGSPHSLNSFLIPPSQSPTSTGATLP